MIACPFFRPPLTPSALPRLAVALAVALVLAAPGAWAFETKAREAFLIDLETNTVLLDKDADTPMPPSSMSKLMTAYMIFERLHEGSLSLDDTFTVSENAWRVGGAASGGSTMFLEPGARVRVEDLLRGIIIQSGNDACVVAAENLAGDEATFARQMTRRAKELGLTHSSFANATGLPDPGHLMTARDLALLAQHIINDFPTYYEIYSETQFTYNGIVQHNRNPLLYKNLGADGLKTGHTSIAGYGLTASAKQGDRRVIMVINGLNTTMERSEEAERLISWAFRNFENATLFHAGEVVSAADVWMGAEDTVPLVVPKDLLVTLPRAAHRDLSIKVMYEGPVQAPIAEGAPIARLVLEGPEMTPLSFPLVAGKAVEPLSAVGRVFSSLAHLMFGWVATTGDAEGAAAPVAAPAAGTGS
ncbi:D-alanyl-D-alanine carboxypeptidase family protein [Pararhodospirillum oryzae]|uniref:serine-type D-Ala-D-Ala carboxypeptidase n=1 Tax=Pararhodospirillum oryzae TaxID=478448 RepID=A0A512H3W0_9PROT|nr:D-alanyl-D-alanine carboxypeptidase family protein [Pararhodospirillum oryzae]GEO80156.1 D-alanyl-D-alanine carboxypeptidase [Pararhodospirillum oryzae]